MSSMISGEEWIVEALGCDAARLAEPSVLQSVFDTMVQELALHPIGAAQWHRFPAPVSGNVGEAAVGGVTGMLMLSESHLTVHTFPEHASACINLFCCTPRAPWPWESRLAMLLGATDVRVRHVAREYAAAPTP